MRNQQHHTPTRLWRVPVIYAACAIVAAAVVPQLETRFLPDLVLPISLPTAVAMYSSIATGMIALTGIVFSLTFVLLQFSATTYSPRLAPWLARDRLLAHAFGIFVATFLFALAALAAVDQTTARVPLISTVAVFGLLLTSGGFFVALLMRMARFQVNRLLILIGERGREVIDALYPTLDGPQTAAHADMLDVTQRIPSQICSYRGHPRTLQAIDIDALLYHAQRSGGTLEVLAAVGDTLIESTPLIHIYQSRAFIDEHLLREAFRFGEERSFEQDPKYALRLLVDIAVKALSPAINDPTTAVQALDQIGDLLLRLSRRRLEIAIFSDAEGQRRLLMPFPTWEDFLSLAFDEICHYGATSIQIMRRMNALISDLDTIVPFERREALKRWQKRLEASIDKHFDNPEDKQHASVADRQGLGSARRRSVA